jgi:HK97 family phage prohead protease
MMEHRKCGFEIRFADGDGAEDGTFEGYGSVFNNVDAYGDVIAPGAFADTLAQSRSSGQWPAMLLNHGGFFGGDELPIGVWTDIKEDERGLAVRGRLVSSPRGQEVRELLKIKPRPALNGLSIGFRAKAFDRGTKPDEPRRKLTKIDLLEVSIVTFPANDQARVEMVKSVDIIQRLSDAESYLRDAGWSRKHATAFISRVKMLANQGDPGKSDMDDLAALVRRGISQFNGDKR